VFEERVLLGNGQSRFLDLVGQDRLTEQSVDFVQFVKESPSGNIIRGDEILARTEIETALRLPQDTVRFINTNGPLVKTPHIGP